MIKLCFSICPVSSRSVVWLTFLTNLLCRPPHSITSHITELWNDITCDWKGWQGEHNISPDEDEGTMEFIHILSCSWIVWQMNKRVCVERMQSGYANKRRWLNDNSYAQRIGCMHLDTFEIWLELHAHYFWTTVVWLSMNVWISPATSFKSFMHSLDICSSNYKKIINVIIDASIASIVETGIFLTWLKFSKACGMSLKIIKFTSTPARLKFLPNATLSSRPTSKSEETMSVLGKCLRMDSGVL